VLRQDPVDPVLSQLARTGVVEVLRITFKHRQSYKQQSITLVTMVTSTPQERELDFGPIQELFTFSPFGLGCQECKINVPIRMDERCIRDHLKKHGMRSGIALVRSVHDMFKAQLDVAKASGTIEPYRIDKKHTQGIHALAVSTFIPEREVRFDIARRLVVMLPN
jgi:hypothetical protein